MFSDEYRRKLVTPYEAAAALPQDAVIIPGLTMAEPPALLQAVADRVSAGELEGLTVYSLLPTSTSCSTVLAPELSEMVTVHTWFVSACERELVDKGREDFIPCHFHQVPRLILDGPPVDACLTTVSPMDANGFFSFGTANDYTSTAARKAELLMVEVNRNMPRVFGQGLVHISEVSHVVENHVPMLPYLEHPLKPEDCEIGRRVAELVPDGACLQFGVGSLPGAVSDYLGDHKDLGVHTEVFGPAMVKLIKQGVITGRRKNLHPCLHVYTVAQGGEEMLSFMNDNPSMASHPVDYVNDPAVIAANERMVSINSLIQVDLTGQCNAEFLAGHQISGTGGQLDFVRGAYDSPGGRSILAFRSTAKGGAVSRVVPRLEFGAAVTTPRMDAHWLVTEYGAVNLKGKSTKQRAKAVIGLAHPDHREELERAAREQHLA
ncbi:MAG: 4-hydroxybutyrate--acetyl-CoA CoA transferase [Desulfarculaceae bacterium]|nr:4-hydroxybutyrate--acetyl-CoA CoA transferase [Desulfarculaceae bacterium]MCF8073783.1 4-hydroxybutyrate--acetyl-CoA CoA transferase [Desulfarculaceae bacterium]MCF8102024.1 4-hydroxybutyrate--acetyl-CoA CoA transferase [Desulfarculaceae bacterium]MCF8115994.1 4-hydroxybutyrate--acetyl-CoA CoA transferase [Desulfarculaceae bacterium]